MIEEDIISAWDSLLDGNVTVGSNTYPVYRTNAATGYNGHYILLRKESSHPEWNKGGFFKTFVLIVEIFTRWPVIINDKLVDDIDDVLLPLVITSPGSTNLNVTGLIKVNQGTPVYLDSDNGSYKIYRKITRFVHQVATEQP